MTTTNEALRFRAAAELLASHSHWCPLGKHHWGHYDPDGLCDKKYDRNGQPAERLCPDCKSPDVLRTDEGRQIEISNLDPVAYIYPGKIRLTAFGSTWTVSRISELRKLRRWLYDLNPCLSTKGTYNDDSRRDRKNTVFNWKESSKDRPGRSRTADAKARRRSSRAEVRDV